MVQPTRTPEAIGGNLRSGLQMKASFPHILSLLVLAGCASPAPTPDAVMKLPPNEVFEVRHSASVPAAVAYKNILERARQCWQRSDRTIDADSFNSRIGVARLSVRKPAESLSPSLVLVVVEVARETERSSRLVGRSLVATPARVGDLQNLPLWAEGKKPACAGTA
jgi:hypothetical protein